MVSEPRTDRTGPPSVRLRRERPSSRQGVLAPAEAGSAGRGCKEPRWYHLDFPPSLIFMADGVFLLPFLRAGHIHPILQQRKEEEPRE